MEKYHIVAFVTAAMMLSLSAVIAYGDTLTARISTDKADDIFRGLATACDGGFIVAGHTEGQGNDMAIMHLSDTGDLIWQKVLTGKGNDLIREVQADCENNSYLIAGMSNTKGFGASDFYTARIGLNGQIISQSIMGTPRVDIAHAIDTTSDGGYIVAGYTTAPDKDKDYLIVKVSKAGSIDWQVALNSTGGDDVIRDIYSLSNGNYLAVGYTRSLGERGDIWAVMLNGTGSGIWQNRYGGALFEESSTILELPDGIVIMEESNSFSDSKAGWIFKIDPVNGNITKQIVLETPGNEELSAAVISNNTILAVGETMPEGSGQKDFFIVTFDFDLNVLSQARLGKPITTEQAETVALLSNGSYVIGGTLEGQGVPGGSDVQIAIIHPGQLTPEVLCDEPIPSCADPVATHATAFESDAVPVSTNVETYSPSVAIKAGSLALTTGGFQVHTTC